MIKAYLAGPDVFCSNSSQIATIKKEICKKYDIEGYYPLDSQVTTSPIDYGIFLANVSLMEKCDCIIANLSPFRGPSADSGTIFEVGYMRGMRRPVFGYSSSPLEYKDRNIEVSNGKDINGMDIEDFGLHENLMIEHALSLPLVVPQPSDSPKVRNVYTDFTLFERLLQNITNFFSSD